MKQSLKIIMGNDEFILYIRKQNITCNKTNDQLGKMIWVWLEKEGAIKVDGENRRPCLWGTGTRGLSKTAHQFEFKRCLLPELYLFLDEIIKNCK